MDSTDNPKQEADMASKEASTQTSGEYLGCSDSSSKEDSGKRAEQQTETLPPEAAMFSEMLPTFPLNFKPKWPLTRAERIAELEQLSIHYDQTMQKKNVRAAQAYHARFPPDQIISETTVYFQNGQVLEVKEVFDIDLKEGDVWDEGPPTCDFMTGHDQESQPIIPAGPSSAITGDASWTCCNKAASGGHMNRV